MNARHALRITLLALCLIGSRAESKPLEVTPFLGAMIPANSLFLQSGGGTYIRMQTHTVYGLALSCPASDKMGLEVVLGAGTGKMELVGGSTILQLGSTLFMADLRGRVRLMGGERAHLAGVLGVGYTDFNSGLFDLAHETGQGTYIGRLTGIAGAEVHGALNESLHLSLSIVDRIHKSGIGLNTGGLDGSQKTQNDIVATAGVSFGL